MLKDRTALKNLYNAFKPEPLPAGDAAYVDYQAVRGGRNIQTELGDHILWSDEPTCSLFTGHRGCGKSTELLRLQSYLENEGATVIYFAADEADIDPEDARYTDILLACTRHLLRALKGNKSTALKDWLENIWEDIKKLATTEIEFKDVEVDVLFMKLNANLRGNPTMRQQIRDQLEPHTVNLLSALNQFILQATKELGDKKIVLIVDNLDRIVPIYKDKLSKTNLEEIFIDRCEQLKGLKCHLVYTVPNSLLYSDKAVHLENAYEMIARLPVIKVREKNRQPYQKGLDAMFELVEKRIKANSDYTLIDVFGKNEIVKELCLMSGGHLRNFVQLLQSTLRNLPQSQTAEEAIHKAIANMRETYMSGINEEDWQRLAEVYISQEMPNKSEFRNLLFGRSILEYCEDGEQQGGNHKWQDVHPLIWDIEQFKRALASVSNNHS